MVHFFGMDKKNKDRKHGQFLIEVSASYGFPLAVAYCHLWGWNGLKKDWNYAFDLCVRNEKINGYHWAQYMLGQCYHYGYGVGKDDKKAFEYLSLSSEQGNSISMNNLGICYDEGVGTDANKTKAFEWFEKSAKLGYCRAMMHVGGFYQDGREVTKNLNTAREWYTKAKEQGITRAQIELDKLKTRTVQCNTNLFTHIVAAAIVVAAAVTAGVTAGVTADVSCFSLQ